MAPQRRLGPDLMEHEEKASAGSSANNIAAAIRSPRSSGLRRDRCRRSRLSSGPRYQSKLFNPAFSPRRKYPAGARRLIEKVPNIEIPLREGDDRRRQIAVSKLMRQAFIG